MIAPTFRVEVIDYQSGLQDLRAVRETVFVQEQKVPIEEEWDALDPVCRHVIARDQDGKPVGTARLTPEHKIGRMAVLGPWRGRGVGGALLAALMAEARSQGWAEVTLNAQVSAQSFYTRHGFVPYGARFMEAGIEHQAMRNALGGATAIEDLAAAIAMASTLIAQSRTSLRIYSRELDPGLLDAPVVLEALRDFATSARGADIQVLLHDPSSPQRGLAPLLPLAQRLPSVFAFRAVSAAVDKAYASAFIVNDGGGYYFRPLGHRFDGEADVHGPGRARQLRESFGRVWERARPCTELRALGI